MSRILLVLDELNESGTGRHARRLAAGLAAGRNEVVILVAGGASEERVPPIPGVTVLSRSKAARSPYGRWNRWVGLLRTIHGIEPDVVHAIRLRHEAPVLLAARLAQVPVVLASRVGSDRPRPSPSGHFFVDGLIYSSPGGAQGAWRVDGGDNVPHLVLPESESDDGNEEIVRRSEGFYSNLLRAARGKRRIWLGRRRTLLFAIEDLHEGGTESQLVDWVRDLSSAGIPVEVVCLRGGGRAADVVRSFGVPVHELRKQNGFDILFPLRQHMLLRRIRPATVISMLAPAGTSMTVGARLAGVPNVIFAARGIRMSRVPGDVRSVERLRSALRHVDTVLTSGERVRQFMVNVLDVPERKVHNGGAPCPPSEMDRAWVHRDLENPELTLEALAHLVFTRSESTGPTRRREDPAVPAGRGGDSSHVS